MSFDQLLHLCHHHCWIKLDGIGDEIVDALLLLHPVPLGDPLSIDTVIGCICKELVSEPRDVVATIENFVVVSKMISLLLWT
jgi:hypothetical protein